MSNYILKTDAFPGLGLAIKVTSSWPVDIQRSLSGKEYRSTWQTRPVRSFELGLDAMRTSYTASTLATLGDLVTSWVRHGGSLDSFLISVPDDNTATNTGFGVGDATTTQFYLQRRQSNIIYDASGGPWYEPDVLWSQQIAASEGPWTDYHCTRTGPVESPIGDGTAYCILESNDGAPTEHYMHTMHTGVSLAANTEYYLSCFVRQAAGGSNRRNINLNWINADGIGFTVQFDLTNGVVYGKYDASNRVLASGMQPAPLPDLRTDICQYYRLWLRFNSGGSAGAPTLSRLTLSDSSCNGLYQGNGIGGVSFWRYNLSSVYSTSYLCPPVASTGAAVVAVPVYWPTVGGGFEVIRSASHPLVLVNGSLQGAPGSYTYSNGVVTFTAPPVLNAVLCWSGSYYRRVRFEGDLSIERIVTILWRGQSIRLVEVI